MKGTRLTLILTAGLVGVLAVSCAKNDRMPGLYDDANEIRFSMAPVKTVTRATAGFKVFPADSAFGTRAYYLPQGKSWIQAHDEADLYIDINKISKQDGVWKAWESGKSYWWPKAGNLSFCSWAPYNLLDRGLTVDNTNGIQIKGWSMPNTPGYGGSTDYGKEAPKDGSTDILIAGTYDVSPATNADATANGVKIQFSHALCKVRFVISLDSDDADKEWRVYSVALKDIYTQGDYSGGMWGNYSLKTMSDYIPEDKTTEPLKAGTFTEIFPVTMMLPQPVNPSASGTVKRNPRIEIKCWDGVTKVDDGKGHLVPNYLTLGAVLYNNTTDLLRWKEGTNITYHLYITTGKGDYIEFDATTTDWTEVDGDNIYMQ